MKIFWLLRGMNSDHNFSMRPKTFLLITPLVFLVTIGSVRGGTGEGEFALEKVVPYRCDFEELGGQYGGTFVQEARVFLNQVGMLNALVDPLNTENKELEKPGYGKLTEEGRELVEYGKQVLEHIRTRMGWDMWQKEYLSLRRDYLDGIEAGDTLMCISEVDPKVDYRYCVLNYANKFTSREKWTPIEAGEFNIQNEFEKIVESARFLRMKMERYISSAVQIKK